MPEQETYDLYGTLSILRLRKSLILAITLATVALGVLCYFLLPKKYKAEAVFILKNPLYSDRNNLYNNETRFIDYFASEADIDRLIGMAESDTVQNRIIREMALADAYEVDTTQANGVQKVKRLLTEKLALYRTEDKDIVLLYHDANPVRAAAVANFSVVVLENAFRNFYNNMRRNIFESITDKISEQDSTIRVLTDTLVKLRKEYGINDIISPSRHNIMLSSMKDNGHPDFARGVELIQNIESIKDEMVTNRSRNITLVNQYTTGTKMNALPLTNVLKSAKPPVKHAGLGIFTVVLICFFMGLFFSILYVLLAHFFKRISSKH